MAKTLYGEYGYTGAPQTITLPPGLYLFELYGAQGNGSTLGGKGAVVYAVFDFSENLDINMYIGNGGELPMTVLTLMEVDKAEEEAELEVAPLILG